MSLRRPPPHGGGQSPLTSMKFSQALSDGSDTIIVATRKLKHPSKIITLKYGVKCQMREPADARKLSLSSTDEQRSSLSTKSCDASTSDTSFVPDSSTSTSTSNLRKSSRLIAPRLTVRDVQGSISLLSGLGSRKRSDLKVIEHMEGSVRDFPAYLEAQISEHLRSNGEEDFASTKWIHIIGTLEDRKFYLSRSGKEVNVSRFKYGTTAQILVADSIDCSKSPIAVILIRKNRKRPRLRQNGKCYEMIDYYVWRLPKRHDDTPAVTSYREVQVKAKITANVFEQSRSSPERPSAISQDAEDQEMLNDTQSIALGESFDALDGDELLAAFRNDGQHLSLGKNDVSSDTSHDFSDTNKITNARSEEIGQLTVSEIPPPTGPENMPNHPILLDGAISKRPDVGNTSSTSSAVWPGPKVSPKITSTSEPAADVRDSFLQNVQVQFFGPLGKYMRTLPLSECSTSQDFHMAALAADAGNFGRKIFKVKVGKNGKDVFIRKGHEGDFVQSIAEPIGAIMTGITRSKGVAHEGIKDPLIISITGLDGF